MKTLFPEKVGAGTLGHPVFFDRNCRGLCLVMVVSDARIINAMVWWAINSRGGKWRLLRVLVRKGHFVAQVQGSAKSGPKVA